jgi:hypothetical protein
MGADPSRELPLGTQSKLGMNQLNLRIRIAMMEVLCLWAR